MCLQDGDIYELVQFVFNIDLYSQSVFKKYSSKCWTMLHCEMVLAYPFCHHHKLLCIEARLHEFIVHQKLKNFTYGLIYKVNTSSS